MGPSPRHQGLIITHLAIWRADTGLGGARRGGSHQSNPDGGFIRAGLTEPVLKTFIFSFTM